MKATRICSIEGCGRKHIARGWCQRHYNRWAKNGTPHLNKLTLRERFEAHYVIEDLGHDTPCWRSTYAVNRHTGYTAIRVDSPGVRRVEMMHRVAYELYVGPIPEGLHIDHLCRQRVCCNPAHLEPVTPGENALRGESPFAKWARQTHCVHGHEFSPENTRRTKTGGRECKECNLERNRQRRARARAAKEAAA